MKKCFWCDRKFKKLTKDHIIPQANGGDLIRYNIVMACQECNEERGKLASFHGQIRSALYNIENLTQNQIDSLHIQRIKLVKIREKWIKIEKEKCPKSASENLEFDPPGKLYEHKPRSLSKKVKKSSQVSKSVLKEARRRAEDQYNNLPKNSE